MGTSWGFYHTSKFEIQWEYIYSVDVAHDHLVKSGGWFQTCFFFYHGNGMMIMMIPNDFPTWRLEATSG